MSCNIVRFYRTYLMVAAILPVGIQFAPASNAPAVSGSYSVVQNKALGSQVQIQMRIHLMNNGPSDLSVQRMTLWDFSHPDKGGSRACALTLHAYASADTIQEFTISRSDYRQWQRGFRPRFVLDVAGPRNAASRQGPKSTVVVRLDHSSGEEGK